MRASPATRSARGYDPLRWIETMEADWVILTLTENLPEEIAPLKLSQAGGAERHQGDHRRLSAGPRPPDDGGPRLRAGRRRGGKLVFHTCRGMRGYSGAPILVSAADNEIQIAGIHVAMSRGDGTQKMLAVPAQAISCASPPWRSDELVRMPGRCQARGVRGLGGQRLVRVAQRLTVRRHAVGGDDARRLGLAHRPAGGPSRSSPRNRARPAPSISGRRRGCRAGRPCRC